MSVLCAIGFHDWRRRSRSSLLHPPTGMSTGMNGSVAPPRPIEYVEKFEQCRRCDKTRLGWQWRRELDAPRPPKPLPWPEDER